MSVRAKIALFWVLTALTLTAVPNAMAGQAPGLFGTREVRNGNLRPFPKWTGMLSRYFADAGVKPGSCAEKTFNKCHADAWQELIDRLQGKDPTTQMNAVNTFMNQRRYIVDPLNWGVRDYWSTPAQFLARYGDCEDYAIAKFLTLKRLGWSGENMRIVVLQDLNLQVAHAVLAVYTGDGIIILDNQIRNAVLASAIHHYRPIFSINEQAWWLHRPSRG